MVDLGILIGVSILIGCFSFLMYQLGDGYYGEDRMLISRKFVVWGFRIALAFTLSVLYTNPVSINERCLYICGYHFMSSFFSHATYYQLKRWFGGEVLFHFLCHSTNQLIRSSNFHLDEDTKTKSIYAYLDLYAFIRILLFILGYMMVNVKYY